MQCTFVGFLVPLVVAASLAAQADTTVYRWLDADGKVHFSDVPPPKDAREASQKRVSGGDGAPVEQLPFATQQAMKRFPVILYTGTECGDLCARGRALLARRGIPFQERNAQANPADAEAVKKLVGALQVPVLLVGEIPLKGYEESLWQAALDGAGYARSALPVQAIRAAAPPEPTAAPPAGASPQPR